MNTIQVCPFQRKALVRAAQAALLTTALATSAAWAEGVSPLVEELTSMQNSVDVGFIATNKDSYKFGEYNGLEKRGVHANVNFKAGLKGGDDSAVRWTAEGSNLGLDSRRLEAKGGAQGTYGLRFLYDELSHRISDSYQTIYNGGGSSALTLPAGYPAVVTRATSTSTAQDALANWNNLQSPNATATTTGGGPGYLIPSLMHPFEVGTKRTKLEGEAGITLLPGWDIRFSATEEHKDGTKLTGYAFATANTAGMFAEPISFRTTNFNLATSYKATRFNIDANVLYSRFTNDIASWTVENPYSKNLVYNNQALLPSAPANEMLQFKLNGGYRFTPKTRLSATLGTSRMTQNTSFVCQTSNIDASCVSGRNGWILPGSSPEAKVRADDAYIKLSSRELKDWTLNAAFKYNLRDNQTPVQTYTVAFVDSPGSTSAVTNDPINTRKSLLSLDAEYALARGQALKGQIDREDISRSTDGSGLAPSRTTPVGSTYYFTLPVKKTREDTLSLEYRNTLVADLTGRVAYAHSDRTGEDYSTPTPAASSATIDATQTALTNAFYAKFRDYFVADRKRDKLRAGLNYQLSDAWGVGFTADYNRDSYTNAALTESRSTILNFDVSFTPNEDFSINPYYSYEDRKSTETGAYIINVGATNNGTSANPNYGNTALTVNGVNASCGSGIANGGAARNVQLNPSCNLLNTTWALSQADKVHTLGLTLKQRGLLAGKLDIKTDLLYIISKTPVTASGGGFMVSDGAATPNYVSIAAQSFPDITSKTTQLRLTGDYKLDKQSTVRMSYLFQKLTSSDWQYDAYTNPVTFQGYLGTAMTSPTYIVNAVGLSYLYRF
ncbi:MAG: MtrB/PioB family decaheme-associated outer membrane protein [Leptothrix sp. (in: b-proteobacteria)]